MCCSYFPLFYYLFSNHSYYFNFNMEISLFNNMLILFLVLNIHVLLYSEIYVKDLWFWSTDTEKWETVDLYGVWPCVLWALYQSIHYNSTMLSNLQEEADPATNPSPVYMMSINGWPSDKSILCIYDVYKWWQYESVCKHFAFDILSFFVSINIHFMFICV